MAAVVLSGDGYGRGGVTMTEAVVTLKAPAAGRSLSSARALATAQASVARRIESALAGAHVRWHYTHVLNGMAVELPDAEVSALGNVDGVAEVWPNVRYHSLAAADGGPGAIGADQLWGANFENAGNGMRIGIIDDGLDATNPYFNPSGFSYPAGFPRGQVQYATPKVIVQKVFTPASPTSKYSSVPFDPANSFHATHVAGIAAGDYGTQADGTQISGVAPNAYIGNYKVLTIPTPGFGLDGNAAEIAAGIDAAVGDGMNVINLSLGEPEVEASRDLVVAAIDGAAAAGVVPVVAAGNDFDSFGYGSVDSPGSAPGAITVAAVNSHDQIADFSSAGPTPVTLRMKPDVSAPGVNVLSSLPARQGTFGVLDGTSMAAPHVAGAAAILKERHPEWTVEEIKSALEQTGDPARVGGNEAPVTREGGGVVNVPRADVPLIFAEPTGVSFGRLAPAAHASRSVALTDAGGGAGTWNVTVSGSGVTAPVTIDVPGTLTLVATGATAAGDTSGFVVLTHGTDMRRIPYWFATTTPKLATEKKSTIAKTGTYAGTTVGGARLVSMYRYPTGGDRTYPGPERVYRVHLGRVANAGIAVLSGNVWPHVTFDGAEDHLAGYTGLPLDLNPYRTSYGVERQVAGVVLPASGWYDLVFDTTGGKGTAFTFRYWVNDTRPPKLRVTSTRSGIVVAATDAGSGVDPGSIVATLDGKLVHAKDSNGLVRIPASKGRHALVLRVSDYQETKNMEDVPPILPNTATLRAPVVVR